jgi:hypothetical protein
VITRSKEEIQMTRTFRIVAAAVATSFLAASAPALAQTPAPDAKPVKKTSVKHHARKPATPAGDVYLRAAGSEPPPKAAK